MRILRAVDRAREYLPLRAVLRFLRLSPSRFHAWSEFASSRGKDAISVRDRPCGPDGTTGRHFEVARVDALLIMEKRSARVRDECPVDVRTAIDRVQRQSQREAHQHVDRPWRRQHGQARVRDLLRQPDVDVQPERCGDLVLKELSEAAMPRIDAAQQLPFVEPESDRVIGLPRPGLPRGFLTREHDREVIQVGDDALIDGLVEGEEPGLVGEELADGDFLFSLLRELGSPVRLLRRPPQRSTTFSPWR
jgi:hypothetical protein